MRIVRGMIGRELVHIAGTFGFREGLRRINDYSFPLEDARAQAAYGIHSAVNKVIIINREIIPERITVVLVDEVLGF